MSPMARFISVKENTKKKEDYESLLPPREGSWTPTNKLFLQLWMKMVKEFQANPLKRWDGLPNVMVLVYSW
jgi:hypothetical protein